jgi:anti-sigma factor RsiW
MSTPVRCEDKDRLAAYLYGEDSIVDRVAVEAHLAMCPACAEEMTALRGVRAQLREWHAPDIGVDFRVVREPRTPAQRWWAAPPLWAQTAAAVLVLSAGAALANLNVRYGPDGVSVTTGWHPPTAAASAPMAAQARPVASVRAAADREAWQTAVRASEDRLRRELLDGLHAQTAVQPTAMVAHASRPDDLLRQVRSLIEESERRQHRELALRLTQVLRDVDNQRRADLMRIEQNMGQIEGFTGAEAAHQRDMLNYLVRVSQQR